MSGPRDAAGGRAERAIHWLSDDVLLATEGAAIWMAAAARALSPAERETCIRERDRHVRRLTTRSKALRRVQAIALRVKREEAPHG